MKKFLLIILLVVIYQALNVIFPNHFFPSIWQILTALIKNLSDREFYLDIGSSLSRILIGFTLAGVAGVFLGLILGYDQRLKDLKLFVELLRPIPPIAWIPIAIIIFGLGNASAYFIVFLGAFFPIFTNTYFGAISIPVIYKNVASSFEINKATYFIKILLFFSLPYIFTGLKIGIGMAWMSVIAAELIAAQSGLGYYIQLNRLLLQTDNIIVGMIFIGVIGNLLQKLIELLEKKIIIWN
ncbi:MAG: ABC transporter permease [Candidatus Beckwithbacteria bacterium]|nr:ABC transporter permease [Candidatus Beckwithbacteria bacterium]